MCRRFLAHLEHVRVWVMTVLHYHCLVSGQCEGDAMMAFAVDRLRCTRKQTHRHTHTPVVNKNKFGTKMEQSLATAPLKQLAFKGTLPVLFLLLMVH